MAPYERLDAWKSCYELAIQAYKATESFPKREWYGLSSQIRRAALSAAVNIAEGSAKLGRREFRRFLDISLGSLAELRCLLRFARDLNYLSHRDWERLHALRERAGVITWSLYKAIRSGSGRPSRRSRPS